MTLSEYDDIDSEHYHDGELLRDRWNTLTSQVFRVDDEHGDNVGFAHVRRDGDRWLYVDELDGYSYMDTDDVELLSKYGGALIEVDD